MTSPIFVRLIHCIIMQHINLTNIRDSYTKHNYVAYQPHQYSRRFTQIMQHIITNIREVYEEYMQNIIYCIIRVGLHKLYSIWYTAYIRVGLHKYMQHMICCIYSCRPTQIMRYIIYCIYSCRFTRILVQHIQYIIFVRFKPREYMLLHMQCLYSRGVNLTNLGMQHIHASISV